MDGHMTPPVATKRAKPPQTDPEDDRNADPSLPLGSTSKTREAPMVHVIHQTPENPGRKFKKSQPKNQICFFGFF